MSKSDKQEEPDIRNDQLEDYKVSRAIYMELIQTGMSGLETLLKLAKESEHPRAFEILGNYLKNVGDLNDKLIDQQRKMQIINQEQGTGKQIQVDDPAKQIAFHGSTKDVLEMLKKARAGEEPPIDAEYIEVENDQDSPEDNT